MTGSARRWTVAPDRARVRDAGRDEGEGRDGTGVTRTPGAGDGVVTAGREGGCGDTTGTVGAAPTGPPASDLPVRAAAEPEELTGLTGAVEPAAPGTRGGISRSGTAGVRCTLGPPGGPANGKAPAARSSPGTGRAESGRKGVPPSVALDRPSSTEWDAVPMSMGFCHVGSRPPNPASATPAGPGAMARWIGGSPGHEAATTGRPPARTSPLTASGAGAESGVPAATPSPAETPLPGETPLPAETPLPTDAPSPAVPRPRNRSRKPTAQPSAPARVTSDAIWSV
ncbi:hypothetical protein [Streptomyces bungoensis]|uniref:hypothetical protein n=1 Tax=Streptomyces bungoensis TaxID=285568 RepID=UPI0033D03767